MFDYHDRSAKKKIKEERDLRAFVPPTNRNKISLNYDNESDMHHYLTFAQFQSNKKEDSKDLSDIFIFTDGSQFIDNMESSSYKKTRKKIKIADHSGYGVFIENENLEVRCSCYFSENANATQAELNAIKESLVLLAKNYDDLKERQVYLFSDNMSILRTISDVVKHKKYHVSLDEFKANNTERDFESYSQIADFILSNRINVSWVRSHINYRQNEIADKLAKDGANLAKHFNELHQTSNIKGVNSTHFVSRIGPPEEKVKFNHHGKIISKERLKKEPHLDASIISTMRYQEKQEGINVKNDEIIFNNEFEFSSVAKSFKYTYSVKSTINHQVSENRKIYYDAPAQVLLDIFKEQNQLLAGKCLVLNQDILMDRALNDLPVKNWTIRINSSQNINQIVSNAFDQYDNKFFLVKDRFVELNKLIVKHNYLQPNHQDDYLPETVIIHDNNVYQSLNQLEQHIKGERNIEKTPHAENTFDLNKLRRVEMSMMDLVTKHSPQKINPITWQKNNATRTVNL